MKDVKELYGIAESGFHWYLTYLTLHMARSTCFPYVLIRRTNNKLGSLILLQVNDTIGLDTEEFLEEEENASKKFRFKPQTLITKKG